MDRDLGAQCRYICSATNHTWGEVVVGSRYLQPTNPNPQLGQVLDFLGGLKKTYYNKRKYRVNKKKQEQKMRAKK